MRSALALELAEVAQSELRDSAWALRVIEEGLKADPESIPLLRLARAIATGRGEFARAREAALAEADALEDRGLAVQALLWAAVASRDLLQKPEQAVGDFRHVLDLDPLQREAAAQLAELLVQRGDSESLIEIQDRQALALARAADPGAAEALEQVALRLASVGKRPQALERLAQALVLSPDQARSHVARAEILLSLSRPEEAAEAYRRAAELYSEPSQIAEAHYQLGLVLQDHLHDAARAATHFQAAASAQPGHIQTLERLALAHEINGNWTGADYALDMLERSTADAATKTRALVAHARVMLDGLRDEPSALAKAQNAHRLRPDDPVTLALLCTLEQRMRDWAAAAESCERLANLNEALDPAASRSFRLRAGEIYLRELRRPTEAIQSYRRALDLDPGDEAARIALADLFTADRARFTEAKVEHRWLLHQDAARADLHLALLRIFLEEQHNDRAYCAVSVLSFLELGDDAVEKVHGELAKRLPAEASQPLAADLRERLLLHPDARTPLTLVLRLTRRPPRQGGVLAPGAPSAATRRPPQDGPSDSPSGRAAGRAPRCGRASDLRRQRLGAARLAHLAAHAHRRTRCARGSSRARTALPPGPPGRFGLRPQPAWRPHGTHRARRCGRRGSPPPHPNSPVTVGRPDADLEKKLAKSLPRKVRKQLEDLAPGPWCEPADGGAAWLSSLASSADRAGLALAGDIASALTVAATTNPAADDEGGSMSSRVRQLPALADLCEFAVSDELFRLRVALGLAIT